MEAISYTEVRQNLAKTIKHVCKDHVPVMITHQGTGAAVLLSLEDFNEWQETLYLLSTKTNAKRLLASFTEDKSKEMEFDHAKGHYIQKTSKRRLRVLDKNK